MASALSEGLALLQAMRPRQWTKNLLLVASLIFAAKVGDAHRWGLAAIAVAAFCAASSAAYLLNDIRDAAADRAHPMKRRRPIAAGRLAPRTAAAAAIVLVVFALGIGIAIGPEFATLLVAFLALQAAYTLVLKRIAYVDVAVIASLFVLRATAGAAGVHVHISKWLLLCTALLSLFLALAKRRTELRGTPSGGLHARASLNAYSRDTLEALVVVVAACSVCAYAAYTVVGARTPTMIATTPLAAFGVGRYLYLVHRHELGEEPEEVLLRDIPMFAAVAAWGLLSALLLVFT